MKLRIQATVLATVLAMCIGAAGGAAAASPTLPEGFLCCNLRTDGSWISDINYMESGKKIVPVGTAVKATGYGRQRVYVNLAGSKQALGNDYSRELDLPAFAARYIVADDPKLKLDGFAPAVRQAILDGRVAKGMTREQVLMAVGYPVTSENPDLGSKVWRFWASSFAEFQVMFDDQGRVQDINADPATRQLVVAE